MRSNVVVVGDTGLIGREVCAALMRRSIPFAGASRGAADLPWPHAAWSPRSGGADSNGLLADAALVFVCMGADGGSEYKKQHSYRILVETIQSFSDVFAALPTGRKCRVVACSSVQAAAAGADRDHVYGLAKRIVEDTIAAMNLASDTLEVSAVRLGHVFGSPDWTGLRRGRLIPTWASRILSGGEPELTDRRDTRIELLWNGDVGEWLVAMSLSPERLPAIIDSPAGLGVGVTLEELAVTMNKVCALHLGEVDLEPDPFERRLLEVVRWVDTAMRTPGPAEIRLDA